jgi:5-formyltetrahydrofolate cyclo-ligase
MDMSDLKQALRQTQRARRKTVADSQPEAGQKLAVHAANPDLWGEGRATISAYWPIGSEIDPRPLMRALAALGHSLALPRLTPKHEGYEMAFHAFAFGDNLERGPLGIMQPLASVTISPDIVVVPLLAFDRSGARLGYGGGYYDRMLHHLRQAKKLRVYGLGFAAQEVDKLPVEAHDERLDGVLTEQGVISFS